MGSLQVPTQRINQAESETGLWFCSEPVNHRVQRLESSVQSPASGTQHPESSVHYLPPESRNSGMPKKPSNILRINKTYDLKIPQSIIYKGTFCYIFSTPKHIIPQAQNEKNRWTKDILKSLRGHSNIQTLGENSGTWALGRQSEGTRRALGHSEGNWVLGHLEDTRTLGGHSEGTRTLGGHSEGTWRALGHLRHLSTRTLRALRQLGT